MNQKLLQLATRHGALKVRIEQQRQLLGQQILPVEAAFAQGDKVLKGVDWLKHHPAAVTLAVAATVLLRPKRAFGLARRGFFLWRGWQLLRNSLAKIG